MDSEVSTKITNKAAATPKYSIFLSILVSFIPCLDRRFLPILYAQESGTDRGKKALNSDSDQYDIADANDRNIK